MTEEENAAEAVRNIAAILRIFGFDVRTDASLPPDVVMEVRGKVTSRWAYRECERCGSVRMGTDTVCEVCKANARG